MNEKDDPRCCICNGSLDDVPSLIVIEYRNGKDVYICDSCREAEDEI